MHNTPTFYGTLCSQFYDATEGYASVAEVDFYSSFIEKNPGMVLEAMSGSGRLLIPLIKRGYNVHGVDSSPAMLARCHERLDALQLSAQLYEQSLEHLSLSHRYATVTIAVGSFQLIYDRAQALQVLKAIRAHMQPGGTLLIDTFTPNVAEESVVTRTARIDNHTTIRLTSRQVIDGDEKIVNAFCAYDRIVDGKILQTEHELVCVTWYTDKELQQLCCEAGFKIIKFHDKQFYDAGRARIIELQ